ncbi:unnamed protein product [Ceratitis capitata]|uniref:(Mediterranean fruit fly) hypothetical protein n=1 Tax=Ceratitis capitata TaxID=7213 RepID=A0A811TYY7_CERCA|nr:unnamed protein product [Ceratitis capitata]
MCPDQAMTALCNIILSFKEITCYLISAEPSLLRPSALSKFCSNTNNLSNQRYCPGRYLAPGSMSVDAKRNTTSTERRSSENSRAYADDLVLMVSGLYEKGFTKIKLICCSQRARR